MIKIAVTVIVLGMVFEYGFCQQPMDNAAAQEYLKSKGYNLSNTQIQNLAKNIQSKSTQTQAAQPASNADVGKDNQAKTQSNSTTEDIKAKTDSLAFMKKTEELSIYESIINNKIVDPDSILKTLRIFGQDVFQNSKPMTFAPENYLATPADYTVGSGDEINILLWGRINEEYRLKVDRDGRINIPHLGPISVAGLPFSAMQKNILDRMQSIEGVQASITMGELHSIAVFIVGEVRSPGMYTISALSNVTNALFAAGGPSKSGSLRAIQLKRNGSLLATIDFYDFLLSGKDNTNLRLKSGDVIVVPIVKKMVAIAGNVRRSALYEIKQSSSLKDIIAVAGGITPAAWTNRIQIERFQDNQFQTVLDIESDKKESIPDFEVQDGDIIKVFPVVIKDANSVLLLGNVSRPGKYEYRKEMKVSDLVPDFQTLQPETYFEYAVVMRQEPPSFLSRIIPFNLKKAMEDHASADNLQIQSKDVVMVYSRDYFEPDRTVTIGGAVTTPGIQKLLENMKIRDLIIKAGGLLEESSTERGELYRRVYHDEVVSTEKIEFNVRRAMEDDPQNNLVLRKFDIVYVRNKKGWEEEKHVELRGEVVYPGDYVLLEGETLGHLIDRSGGFTKDAYLPAAVLTRPSVGAYERKRMEQYANRLQSDALKVSTEMMAKQQDPTSIQLLLQQQQLLISKLKDQETGGRVVIDLTNPDQYRNFVLENGDGLYIPKMVGTISVIGEVFNPATFKFENNNLKAQQLIEMAGGFKENADTKFVYVFKANGSVLTRKNANIMQYTLSPGDVVVVPQKLEYTNNFKIFMDSIDSISKITALVLTVATLVVLLKR